LLSKYRRRPMRRSRLLVLLASAGLCVAGGAAFLAGCGVADATSEAGTATTAPSSGIAGPSSSSAVQPPAWLLERAKWNATRCGDPHPELAEWAISHRAEATRVLTGSEIFDGDPRVYVLVLKGQFTDTMAVTPQGQNITGTWLLAVYDARTHEPLDFGLQDKPLHAEQLGPVHGFSF
jgi:hypothetical protein